MLPSMVDEALKLGKSALSAKITFRVHATHGLLSVEVGSSEKEIEPGSVSGVVPRTFFTVIGSEPTLEITQCGEKPSARALPRTAAVAPGIVSRKTTLQLSSWNFEMYGAID